MRKTEYPTTGNQMEFHFHSSFHESPVFLLQFVATSSASNTTECNRHECRFFSHELNQESLRVQRKLYGASNATTTREFEKLCLLIKST